jgi:hypothetical protein
MAPRQLITAATLDYYHKERAVGQRKHRRGIYASAWTN